MPKEEERQEQHVYHHYDNDGARINASFEQNSRGVNYSATVTGAKTVREAITLLIETKIRLEGELSKSPQITPSTTEKEKVS